MGEPCRVGGRPHIQARIGGGERAVEWTTSREFCYCWASLLPLRSEKRRKKRLLCIGSKLVVSKNISLLLRMCLHLHYSDWTVDRLEVAAPHFISCVARALVDCSFLFAFVNNNNDNEEGDDKDNSVFDDLICDLSVSFV